MFATIGAKRRRGRFAVAAVTSLLAATLTSSLSSPAMAADEALSVDFSITGGAPRYLGSGTIYGMTEEASDPPGHFLRDIKWNYMRAGGAQLDNPGGWVGGTYPRRWAATLAQARRTAALGGQFQILVHDLWGADAETNAGAFPGDNGNWSSYDEFMTRLINDARGSGLSNLQWDLWNEPDYWTFWKRSQEQYLAMWDRGFRQVRAAFPGAVVVGPSTAVPPAESNSWMVKFLENGKAQGTLPNIYSWHALPSDPVANVQSMNSMLASRGIRNARRYSINEYASYGEQNAADAAWYLTRLERADAEGLRANWGLGRALNDYLANLLVKAPDGQYLPRGEWWVYKFYGSQTGNVVSSSASASYDAFATKASGSAKILVGGGGTTGNVAVNLQRLDATVGLVQENKVRVVVQTIPNGGGGAVQGPTTTADYVANLSNNGTVVNLPHYAIDDAFTITLLPPSDGSFQSVAVAQHSQHCLDNTNLIAADGNQQQQYHCEGGDQQQWRFVPVPGVNDTFTARNVQSGKCLDVRGVSTADGAPVHQWTCHGGANQQFMLRKVTYSGSDPHDYQLLARHSGKCVDVSGISTALRAPVHQWTCVASGYGSTRNQTWRLWGR